MCKIYEIQVAKCNLYIFNETRLSSAQRIEGFKRLFSIQLEENAAGRRECRRRRRLHSASQTPLVRPSLRLGVSLFTVGKSFASNFWDLWILLC